LAGKERRKPVAHNLEPFGVIFCGPPGQFSVWTLTPDGELLDRGAAELLGQLAVRAGAADYRTFRLQGADLSSDLSTANPSFMGSESAARYEQLFVEARGVPAESPGAG
jgi:hypothetical protein